jgi:Fungal Zn(2)-Cys(6) binuclear cluster domain
MRACEGCRRRKIKCDAASTNTWPCSACTRLKLHCIPPTGGNDRDYAGTGSLTKSEEPVEYSISHTHCVNAVQSQSHPSHQYSNLAITPLTEPIGQYAQPNVPYQLSSYSYSPDGIREQYLVHHQASFPTPNPRIQGPHPYYPHQTPAQVRQNSSISTSESEHTVAEDLSEALGELTIAETGIGKFASSTALLSADGLLSILHKAAG